MRILLLHQYYCPPKGWGNDRSRDFARTWAANGHELTILTTQAYFPPDQRQHRTIDHTTEGCRVIALPVAYEQRMSFRRRVWAFVGFFLKGLWVGLRLPRPDVIYASSTPPTVGWMGRLLALRFRCPWVFEVVDVWPQVPIGMGLIPNRLLQRLLHALTDPLYRSAWQTIALSPGMKQQVLERGIPPSQVQVVLNGTQPDRFQPAETSGPPLRIVYVGAVGRANGLEALVAAAREVLARRSGVRFEVRGWGSHWAALQQQTADLEGFDCLPALPKEELPAWLAGAAVGVCVFAPFPVLEANSANKFYDYLASGLPVVLNYGGWQAEVLDRWGCGLWAPMGDPAAFVEALLQLIDRPDLRQQMGTAARQWAIEHADRRRLALRALEAMKAAADEQNTGKRGRNG